MKYIHPHDLVSKDPKEFQIEDIARLQGLYKKTGAAYQASAKHMQKHIAQLMATNIHRARLNKLDDKFKNAVKREYPEFYEKLKREIFCYENS
jgi:hypothetical protein